MNTLANRIRQRREDLGMSQDELAIRLGYKSRSTIAKIEAGENDITQSKIVKFAGVLKTTTAYLMGWSDKPDGLDRRYAPSLLGLKIRELRGNLDFIQLSDMTGIDIDDLISIESGYDERYDRFARPTDEEIASLAVALEADPALLYRLNSNDQERYRAHLEAVLEFKDIDFEDDLRGRMKVMTSQVPVFGRIPAGTPFEAIQDKMDSVSIPDWLAAKKDLFGLLVLGDSMNKIIPDGAIAVLQRTTELNNGEIGAVMVNGFDATLKKFFKLTDSIVLEPISYNPENKPIVIGQNTTEVKIIGKLLWYCAAGEIK